MYMYKYMYIKSVSHPSFKKKKNSLAFRHGNCVPKQVMQKYRIKGGSEIKEATEEERLPLVMQYTDIGEILDENEEAEEGLREKKENLILMEYNSKTNNLNNLNNNM